MSTIVAFIRRVRSGLVPQTSVAFLSFFLLMLATGCASTQMEPLTGQTPRAALNPDELDLWETSAKVEEQIAERIQPVEGHEEIEQYLHAVLERVVPDFNNPQMRVRIRLLPDSNPNAFVLANGAMYVNTGLLALLDNEAQLATVLGHEFCHFRNRHSYREKIKEKNESIRGALLGGALAALTGDTNTAHSVSEFWRVSSVRGYSRDLELEADHMSLEALVRAGYEPQQAIMAFERLLSVAGPEASEKRQRFATHPKLEDRIASYRQSLQDMDIPFGTLEDGIGEQVYNSRLFSTILYKAQLNLDEQQHDLARDNITRCLKLDPNCARAYFLDGEWLRRGPSDDEDAWRKALVSYERSIEHDPKDAHAYREAGLLQRQLGNRQEALRLLTEYLDLLPDAPDAAIVEARMKDVRDPNWTAAKPYRAPVIDANDFAAKVRKIGLMPISVATQAADLEKRKEELEATLRETLEQAGFTVIPSSAYSAIFESLKTQMGPLFDPNTGKPLQEKRKVLADHTHREYLARYQVDALAYPAVVVAAANWNANVAAWHGVQEASTGKEGFWATLAAPSAYGRIPALSFRLVLANLYGKTCRVGFGGIQLYNRVAGGGFVDVPAYELLANPEKNTRGVRIACQGLQRSE